MMTLKGGPTPIRMSLKPNVGYADEHRMKKLERLALAERRRVGRENDIEEESATVPPGIRVRLQAYLALESILDSRFICGL